MTRRVALGVALGAAALDLGPASFDPATRTCPAVACHRADTAGRRGTPCRWNNTYECNVCHRS